MAVSGNAADVPVANFVLLSCVLCLLVVCCLHGCRQDFLQGGAKIEGLSGERQRCEVEARKGRGLGRAYPLLG